MVRMGTFILIRIIWRLLSMGQWDNNVNGLLMGVYGYAEVNRGVCWLWYRRFFGC